MQLTQTDHYVAALRHSIAADRAMGRCIVARIEAGLGLDAFFDATGRCHRTGRDAATLIMLSKLSHRRICQALRSLKAKAAA